MFTATNAIMLILIWGTFFGVVSFAEEVKEIYKLFRRAFSRNHRRENSWLSWVYLPVRLIMLVAIPWAIITMILAVTDNLA